MSQARLLWTLARFKLGLWLASGFFASLMFYLMPLLPGLVVRRIFPRRDLAHGPSSQASSFQCAASCAGCSSPASAPAGSMPASAIKARVCAASSASSFVSA